MISVGIYRLLRAKADNLRVSGMITQHWFRHKLATDFSRGAGGLTAAKNQGGWKDTQGVLGYLIEDTAH